MNDTSESSEPSMPQFTELQGLVTSKYEVEESFIEYETPTFYVKLGAGSKKAFLELVKELDSFGLIPVLRREEGKYVLRIVWKPPVKPSRPIINVILFIATVCTTFLTGYFLSLYMPNPYLGAAAFSVAILAVLGTHEMAHNISARRHGVQATAPYFIPGLPPPGGIGTFGAVIQQKSLPPNRDALFDIGAMGPIIGFIVAAIVSAVGISWSQVTYRDPVDGGTLPFFLLLRFIANVFPPSGTGNVIELHPVAFAGWVGMFITMLNLLPAGQLDGGHTVKSLTGGRWNNIFMWGSILILIVLGITTGFEAYFFFSIFVFLLSMYKTPAPLDNVSQLSTSRKLAIILLIGIFILCIDPYSIMRMFSL